MAEVIGMIAEHFIGVFSEGGSYLKSLIVDIVPMIIVLMTLINAIIAGVGEEKVLKFCNKLSGFWLTRWVLLPMVGLLLFMSPACFTIGKFLPEKYKVSYYDCVGTFLHPILGIFPHANAGEYFIFTGIAAGITALGLSTTEFGLWYFVAGMIVSIFRGFFTEMFYKMFSKVNTEGAAGKE